MEQSTSNTLLGDSQVRDERLKTELQAPNGLHIKPENGVKEKVARVYSRKRTRDPAPEVTAKMPRRIENQEQKVNDFLGRTADMVLVLSGLAQMRGGKPPTDAERKLAEDAHNNLTFLVSKVAPSSLVTKSSVEDMIKTMGFRKTPSGSLEPAPKLQLADKQGEDSDSDDDSSDSTSMKDDGSQIVSGLLTSPSALSLDDEADAEMRQNEEFEEYQDEQSQLLRHRQLSKLVQQVKSESYVPLPQGEANNSYMIAVMPCGVCQSLIKDTSNVIVCDGCEKAYHCLCLNMRPSIASGVDWCCPKCNGVKPKYGPVNKSSTPNKMPIRKPMLAQTANGPTTEPGRLSNSNSNSSITNTQLQKPGTDIVPVVTKPEQAKPAAEAITTPVQQAQGSVTLHVDWVDKPVKVIPRKKAYYDRCFVGGWTYKLHDCALFRTESADTPPYIARLQALWEDLDSGSKWVRVNWLYYPNDMPAGISGRPENVQDDEVFETNHCDDNLVGSIQGPCEVLESRKYDEEKEKRRKSPSDGKDLPPVFLCNWFYDAPKGEFRRVGE